MISKLSDTTQSKISIWKEDFFDTKTKISIKNLEKNLEELEDCFYKDLEFGTGGMRGVMGVGTNRINRYTLGRNTQGLSNYLNELHPDESVKVAIAYDCRHNSKKFAKIVADVFSANGIKVFLFEELRTTPELSFTVKHLECHCGIVLTASHNPPEYNGYKVYWKDGGQLVPPHDKILINLINELDYRDVKFNANKKLIEFIGSDVDRVFIQKSVENGKLELNNDKNRNELSIVFTSLHGTAITAVPETLKLAGFKNVHIVDEQSLPNGDFPTVKSPNPEEPEALEMAIDLANKVNADIVIGTDPDCDRLGIAVRDNSGELVLLNGNQTMVVMTKFLIEHWKNKGKINNNQFIGSTIVSTPMLPKLASHYGVDCKISLTGFKWIAKMIEDFPKMDFIAGGEESYGFMVGDFVRDKDAVTSTLLACEIAAFAKSNGSSFFNELIDLYSTHGFYKERLVSITKKGKKGSGEIKNIMKKYRNTPPHEINGSKVVLIEDYLNSTAIDVKNNRTKEIVIPKANVLIFKTADDSKVALRPSGTEPKIKYYISVNDCLKSKNEFKKINIELEEKIDSLILSMNL